MKYQELSYKFLTLADELVNKGYWICDHILDKKDFENLLRYFDNRLHQFSPAKIGRGLEKSLNHDLRSDQILWLEDSDQNLVSYFDIMNHIQDILKKELFLPIKNYETQMAWYGPGASYTRHRDRHKNSDARCVSSVFYMNEGWNFEDGGQLLIQTQSKEVSVEPVANRLVIFKSELEHEVLVSNKNRKSLATWFRVD